jgi:cytochrome P450
MARFENQMLRGAFLDDGRNSFIVQENYRQLKADTFRWLNRILDDRLASPGTRDDNAELAFQARRQEQGAAARRDQFLNDLYLILVAGTDNTTALINWALMYTFRHPAWLGRLRAELAAWDGRDPLAIAQMPCLKATVMETQRLRPGSPFTFGGYAVPGGTDVVHAYVLGQFLEEHYPEPFAFRPERFLESGKFVPKSFGFFGGGTHVCVGRNLTMMQAPLAIAHAVRGYDLELEAEPQFELKVGSAGRRLDEQIMARLQPR